MLIDSGFSSAIRTSVRDSNEIILIEVDHTGYLFINGLGVAALRLTSVSQKREVRPLAGYFAENQPPGTFTQITDVSIYAPKY